MLRLAFDKFKYSARTYNKFLGVARTFADMEYQKNINKSHILKVFMCRKIKNEQATIVVVQNMEREIYYIWYSTIYISYKLFWIHNQSL